LGTKPPKKENINNTNQLVTPQMPPLTFQTTFAPEIDLSSVLLTCNKIWRPETAPTSQPTQIRHEMIAAVVVSKPPGQVTEISKGGYSLEDVLQWPDGQYTKVQVWRKSVFLVLKF
jgi:hypothetical protein